MFTKDEIDQLKALLTPLEEKISNIEDKLVEKTTDLENSLEDKTTELKIDIFNVRAEFQNEIKHVRRVLKEIRESQNTIIKFTDERYTDLRQKVDHLEKKCSIFLRTNLPFKLADHTISPWLSNQ